MLAIHHFIEKVFNFDEIPEPTPLADRYLKNKIQIYL
jgi:hypothetical protein